ncbi:integrase-like protein [Nonomuraea fuscirosea]|uniref:Integrase-like protein n=1 Tax=Nonomuraea fuscirosea TaxID=1291556 RepID=A0A2T0MQ26_9ACTN|nr:integrase-like protein [Nonomuraea fuscirosea]
MLDLFSRDFTAAEPGRKYMGDITYLPLSDGTFLYLATVLDCFSHRVVGWSIADHMRTDLVADALMMAAAARGGLAGSLFHSDHGAQGGFNWSSQHLDPRGGVLWRREEHARRSRLVVCRLNHRDGRRSIGGRSGSVSGG